MAVFADAGVDVALADGGTVRVRQTRPDDVGRLELFLAGLSDTARYFRFFSGAVHIALAAERLIAAHGLGLVAVTGDGERVVAHAVYVPLGSGRAEVAFAVAGGWEGRGLATTLLAELAEVAVRDGIEVFTAEVLPANHKMIKVFRASGFPVEVTAAPGELHVSFPTSLTVEGRQRFEDRDALNASAAVAHVLRPASIAVVGASRRPGTAGREILRNVMGGGFTGSVYAVNPHATEIAGAPTYATVGELPEAVELAVIALPADAVVPAARECADAGVRALLVISAGFAETGAEGMERQRALLGVCRAAGMRMVGPNCLGIVNTDPEVSLDATFAPGSPPHGHIAFASQSGGFGLAALSLARARGIGISSFVSLGDKADLSGNDFLEFWEHDGDTDVVMLYLESFGNPRKFGRIARRVAAHKPIIAVKGGRSAAGHRAASSHTGALLAATDATVDALFRHAGVIRADTVAEMFDVAAVLSRQPLPGGNRVAIVTNAGGPGILCADACEANGLAVVSLASSTRGVLAGRLPAEASIANPVDLIASATADDYSLALGAVLADPDVDAVIVVFVRPLATRAAQVAEAIQNAASSAPGKPVVSVFLGDDVPECTPGEVPVFDTVEEATRALGHAARYAAHRRTPLEAGDPPAGIDADRAAAVIAAAGAGGDGWLEPAAVEALLRAYGLPLAASRLAATPHAVGLAAAELGGPVALKGIAAGLVHKTDAGAVRLGLATPTAAVRAAGEMRERLAQQGHPPTGFVVQAMADPGPEMIVGVVGDPQFGPLVAVGAGGTAAELIGDVQVRLAPVGPLAAGTMLRELRTFALLDGYRGAPKADVIALGDVVVRVSALAAAHPEIAELDCNPVLAGSAGALIADARVRLRAAAAPRPYGALDR